MIPLWPLNCENPEAIGRLFDSLAGLDEVELHEIVLQRDGPRLQLRFDLPRFPDHPPARWPADANAVQVTIDLWMITELAVTGWHADNPGVLTLEPSPDGLRISFTGRETSVSGRCASARIVRVSEYMVEAPDPVPPSYFEAPATEAERLHPGDLVGACFDHDTTAVLLDDGSLPPEFFDLSSGMAGDLVQRGVNYGLRMAAVVPDPALHSRSFQDFAREAARSGQFRCFRTRAEAVEWLDGPR